MDIYRFKLGLILLITIEKSFFFRYKKYIRRF